MTLTIGETNCSASFLLKFFSEVLRFQLIKYFNLSLDSDLNSLIMPKVKTTYAYKIQSIVKNFPDEFIKSINN